MQGEQESNEEKRVDRERNSINITWMMERQGDTEQVMESGEIKKGG